MAVPPLLLNQINDAHQAFSEARDVLQDTLNLNAIDHESLNHANSFVEEAIDIGTIPINTINEQGLHLPDYIKNTIDNIGDRFGELGDIMYSAIEEYEDNKPLMIEHLNTALGIVQAIEEMWTEIIQIPEQPQDDSNNGSNNNSNVSYDSNGGRRKKRTLRKRRNHSKKRKQTQRKRTNRKRTHRKRTNRK